jgi:hypothetical protein
VEGFKHGGWSSDLDEEAGQFKFEEAMVSEAMLLGRKTYQTFAQAWPSQEGEFADKFNTMPKYVVSSTLRDPSGPTPPSFRAGWPRRWPGCASGTRATCSSTAIWAIGWPGWPLPVRPAVPGALPMRDRFPRPDSRVGS